VPARTSPAGTIQSIAPARRNENAHHASSAAPASPAAAASSPMVLTAAAAAVGGEGACHFAAAVGAPVVSTVFGVVAVVGGGSLRGSAAAGSMAETCAARLRRPGLPALHAYRPMYTRRRLHSVASRQVLRIRGGTACIPCIQSFAFFPFFFLLTKVIKFDTLRYMICILEDPEGSRPVELHAGVNLIRSFLWRKYWNISL